MNTVQRAADVSGLAQEATLEAIASPIQEEWNNRDFTYVSSGNGAGNIETIVYKFDSTTVATRTFTYDSSHNLVTDTVT